MDVSHILDDLNEEQRQAVAAPLSNLLVLAGAGSGKTRVLVHRIAWLIKAENASPFSILAVTFTNKAAAEMRGRLEELLNMPTQGMWVGTFHSLAHRLLRAHWEEAKLPRDFQILDADDQFRLIRRIQKSLDLDEARWPPRQIQWFINSKKDEGLRAEHIPDQGDIFTHTMLRVYKLYEETCERSGMIDFAELLLRSFELWRDNPDILAHYQQRFSHLLVDEFQDTNAIQYAWLSLLASPNTDIMIVGDDDQSIYGWRGAKVENMMRFTQDFPDAETIRLERNYRSTQVILNAANELISHNGERLGKSLWTERSEGEKISVYGAFNELDEARFVTGRVMDWIQSGNARKEIAILYRSNAQSRVLEEALLQAGIPYRIYGGFRFFERAEIKDALGYLRLIANPNSDAGFERIVNVPPRGIGDKTISILREEARAKNSSLWSAAKEMIDNGELSSRATSALQTFIDLIQNMRAECQDLELAETTQHVLQISGLLDHYRKDKSEKGRAKVENLDELITAARQYDPEFDDDEEALPLLDAFLAHAALEAGENQADPHSDCVQLMTLHTAKGLEFPLVFLCGVEDGLFPNQRSVDESGGLEEERRLCYVGITRAMQKLYITYAERRRLYGREEFHRPSRFIAEIPADLMEEVRARRTITRPTASSAKSQGSSLSRGCELGETGFKMGQRVTHPKFGDGVVINYEGQGSHARVQVQFSEHGCKWLILTYANLQLA